MSLMTLILAAALGLNHAAATPAAGLDPASHQAGTASILATTDFPEAQDPGMMPATGYAQREAQSKDLETFTGGHEVVVVGGCVCLVILILILI
jgi:hypothetical protein